MIITTKMGRSTQSRRAGSRKSDCDVAIPTAVREDCLVDRGQAE